MTLSCYTYHLTDRYIPWWPRTNSNAFPIEVYAKLIRRWRVCCSICGRNRLVKVSIGLYCVLNNLTAIYEKFYLKWCEIWNIQRPGLGALQCKIFICIDYLFFWCAFWLVAEIICKRMRWHIWKGKCVWVASHRRGWEFQPRFLWMQLLIHTLASIADKRTRCWSQGMDD